MRKTALALAFLLSLVSCAPDEEKPAVSTNSTKAAAVALPSASGDPAPLEAEKKMEAGVPLPQPNSGAPEATAPARAPAASLEEIEHASSVLQFSNQAREILEERLSRPAERMRENVAAYLETWHIAKFPDKKDHAAAIRKLRPEEGIFSPEEERDLARALDGMDKALAEMARHYGELEKYVADVNIRDNGKKGRQLGSGIERDYGKFAANRRSWLEIVEKRAEKAEEVFLQSHPLERQIAGARAIFAQFREIAALINSGSVNFQELSAMRQNIEGLVAECGKPPFNASPGLERLYRSFLGKAAAYCKALNMAMAEGMHGAQKRELNSAINDCRKAYNEFVRKANLVAWEGGNAPEKVVKMTNEEPARPSRPL